MTVPLVAGNWKMNGSRAVCVDLARKIARNLQKTPAVAEVLIGPPFTALPAVEKAIRKSKVKIAAQNCHWQDGGAFTGEISPSMLSELNCAYVIVGHSERRHILHEDDDIIARKPLAIIGHGMRPILCVGETLEERQTGQTTAVIVRQLQSALKGLGKDAIDNVEIAYEPVWAIGTGLNATPEQIKETHVEIRNFLGLHFGDTHSRETRILYGGSVKPDNAALLAEIDEVNGFLVGGASLTADTFLPIVQAFSK